MLYGENFVVFDRDLCQVFPIMCKGTREQQIDANLVSSYTWLDLIKIRLTENISARLDLNFSNFLLQFCDGIPLITIQEKVKIPYSIFICYENDSDS